MAAAGPRGCSQTGPGRWTLAGAGCTSTAGRRELCPATARKQPDFPEMSVSGETWETASPLGREGSQGSLCGMLAVAVGRGGPAGRAGPGVAPAGGSSPATLSLPSDQIFIRAGAGGHGKGFAWGQPVAGRSPRPSAARPVGAQMIKRRGKDKL